MVVVLFILLLSVIIVIHEFGHLIAAKIFGVYCGEFSMGMGPKILSYKGKETTYSLRLIPIGGFVSMAGDADNDLETKTDDEDIPFERTLKGIKTWKKIIIMMAGVLMNLLLALVITSAVFLYTGFYATSADTTIAKVNIDSPAYNAGIQDGDKIVKLSYKELGISHKPKTFEDMTYFMYGNEEHTLTMDVLRNDEVLSFDVTPEFDQDTNRYIIGINANQYNVVEVNITNCLWAGFDYLYNMTRTIFMSLGQLVKGIGFENLSGPVGIFDATSQAVNAGFTTYILMVAMMSLNVGIFNALPLPILDGGRVVIAIIEKIIGRPLSDKAINIMMTISMAMLIILLVFATMQDIKRIF